MKNIEEKDVKNQVIRYRERAGLTQEELAEELGISHVSVSHIETNRTQTRGVVMLKLAKYFQVPVECLFVLKEDEFAEDEQWEYIESLIKPKRA